MTVRIINADVMDGLRQLPDESVHCVVTSPPYWGLRDYGTGTWEGGDDLCDHLKVSDAVAAVASSTLGGGKKSTGHQQEGFKDVCGKCGARRIDRQIGLEKTPAEFVARMVEVFREVRRVLKSDGVCFVNLGDSYASASANGGQHDFSSSTLKMDGRSEASRTATLARAKEASRPQPAIKRETQCKPKDLVGIPWRVAFALQDDGWWLRQDIIWHKPNPMPESVTDRCTKAHEYIFLLTKSARYYWDQEAIADSAIYAGKVVTLGDKSLSKGQANGAAVSASGNGLSDSVTVKDTRNKRSVWTIATAPFSEAHFATFPPEIPEICIKAGSKPGDTILDPFSGAGTTALVADRLQRNAIGIELNPEYAAMSERRLNRDRGGLLDIMEQTLEAAE